MSRQYAIKIRFQGRFYISEDCFSSYEEADQEGKKIFSAGAVEWQVETIRSITTFEKETR